MRSAVVASSRRHPKAGVARILGVRNSKSSVHTSLCPIVSGVENVHFSHGRLPINHR